MLIFRLYDELTLQTTQANKIYICTTSLQTKKSLMTNLVFIVFSILVCIYSVYENGYGNRSIYHQ